MDVDMDSYSAEGVMYPLKQNTPIQSDSCDSCFDASQLTDSQDDDCMSEALLSVNIVKVSHSSEDSGIFSETGSESKLKQRESQSRRRRAIPYDTSPETPCEIDIAKNVAFRSTPVSLSPGKSPKRRCRRFSRDLFQKRSSITESDLYSYNNSLVGVGTVDFLAHLGEHSCLQPALDSILNYLSPEDLCRASAVSRSWKNIIDNIPSSRNRKRGFIEHQAQIKENLHQVGKKSDESCPLRGQLLCIQNINYPVDVSQSSQRSPPVSPSKVRFNLFLKEGQKLEYGQALVPCPQCMLPSHRKSENSALCSRRGCQYHFCTKCLCKFHNDRPCPVSVRHRKRQVAIGSRQSRRNLLRLCQ